MFDAFTKVIAQADARGEFISAGQIDALAAMVSDSNKRMDTVNRITSNASAIVTNAARDLFGPGKGFATGRPVAGWNLPPSALEPWALPGVWPDGIGGAWKRQGAGGPRQPLICNDCESLWIRSKQTQRIRLPPFSAAPAYLPQASHAHDTRQRCPPGHRQPWSAPCIARCWATNTRWPVSG